MARSYRTQKAAEGGRHVARAVTCAVVGFDRLAREAVSGMLSLRVGLRTVVQAAGITDGRDMCLPARPDVVILDFGRLGKPVLTIAERLFAMRADSRAVLITSSGRQFRPPPWLPADRHAVVGHDQSFDALLAALESLFVDRLVADGARRRHKPLTDREAQIMALLGEGLTTREVAAILGRSPHTIQTHRKRIAEKVGWLGSRIARRMASQRNDGHDRRDGANRPG